MKKKLFALLMAVVMLLALVPASVFADEIEVAPNPLQPAANTTDEYVNLSKTAVETAPGKWKITLQVNVKKDVEPAEKAEVVFVMDTSGSMAWCMETGLLGLHEATHDIASRGGVWCGGPWFSSGLTEENDSRLAIAKKSLKSLIAQLNEKNVPINLVTFASGAKDGDITAVDSLKASGGTDLSAGVNMGIGKFSTDATHRVLIILADGDSNDGYPTGAATSFKESTTFNGEIYTIGLAYNDGSASFKNLATNTAHALSANSAVDLDNIVSQIAGGITGNAIVDTLGADVALDGDITAPADSNVVYDSTTKTIEWSPAVGAEYHTGDTFAIEYNVEISTMPTSAGDYTSALNTEASFTYVADGEAVILQFPVPVASYTAAERTVEYVFMKDGAQTTTDVPAVTAEAKQVVLVGQNLSWAAPAGTLDADVNGAWVLTTTTYDEATYVVDGGFADGFSVNDGSILTAATAGTHAVVHTYTYQKASADYQILYYLNDGSGNYVLQENDSKTLSAEIGSTVTATVDSYEGYTFNAGKSNITGEVRANHDDVEMLVLKLYYDKNPEPTPAPTAKPTAAPVAAPATGDNSNMMLWVGLAVLAIVGAGVVLVIRPKNNKKNH